jgi:hypothetical protein
VFEGRPTHKPWGLGLSLLLHAIAIAVVVSLPEPPPEIHAEPPTRVQVTFWEAKLAPPPVATPGPAATPKPRPQRAARAEVDPAPATPTAPPASPEPLAAASPDPGGGGSSTAASPIGTDGAGGGGTGEGDGPGIGAGSGSGTGGAGDGDGPDRAPEEVLLTGSAARGRIRSQPPPQYPAGAQEAGVEGTVRVHLWIDADGKPRLRRDPTRPGATATRPLRQGWHGKRCVQAVSGPPELRLDAVQHWAAVRWVRQPAPWRAAVESRYSLD